MKMNSRSRAGFTLIEVIAVLVLSGIGLAFGSMLFVTTTQTFLGGKDAVEDSQKLQAAMNRLVKELTFAGSGTVVVSNSGRTINWISHHPDRYGQPGVATWDGTSGSSIKLSATSLGAYELLDNVGTFSVSSTEDSITITLSSSRSGGVNHTVTFHPRYES